MKRDLFVVALCFIAGLSGANVQPILTGAGKLIFPENATPATISASGGALTVAAGGTNQPVTLEPSGTGLVIATQNTASLPAPIAGAVVQIGGVDGTGARLAFDSFGAASGLDLRTSNGTAASPSALALGGVISQIGFFGYGATGYSSAARAYLRAFAAEPWTDAAQGTFLTFGTTPTGSAANAERMRIFASGGASLGSTTDPGAGVLNAASGFAKGGTAGVGNGSTITVCTGSACTGATTCTLIFNGGIRTGGTCL